MIFPMTTTTSNAGASNPAQIDSNALLDLATFHLSTAAKREREFTDGPAAGTMAVYLTKIDELITEIENCDDPILMREWVSRLGSIFRIGVDFGIETAAAIVNQPFGSSKTLLAGALKAAKSELQDVAAGATQDAANVHQAARKAGEGAPL
jgi:hypothetical protein